MPADYIDAIGSDREAAVILVTGNNPAVARTKLAESTIQVLVIVRNTRTQGSPKVAHGKSAAYRTVESQPGTDF